MTPPGYGRTHALQYQLAREGREPAEALPTPLRHRLVLELHAEGWSVEDIAVHTRQTPYTTARILRLLDAQGRLPHTRPRAEMAA